MPRNPLAMNDWPIATTLRAVVALQLVVWICIGTDVVGVHVPLVRELSTLVYLFFIPGILLLRVLRIHRLGSVTTTLFAVGLSAATTMFTALGMNFAYPPLGITKPIALLPVVATISAVVVLLAVIAYGRDRDVAEPCTFSWGSVFTPQAALLALIPFLSVFATYAMNVYQTNLALLALIVVLIVVALWVSTSSAFPRTLYPFAVFVVALALLYHGSLISSYVWGWDVQQELYQANLVLGSGVWATPLPGNFNAVLSVTLLAPITALLTGISVVWLFKIVYPLVFALVPLGIFAVARSQTSDRVALLSAFFVTFLFTFFTELPALARQEIAELFLVLILLVVVNKNARWAQRRTSAVVLYAVFSASLIVSHYMLAYIVAAYLVIAWLLLFLVDNPALRRLHQSVPPHADTDPRHAPRRSLTLVGVLLFVLGTNVWYITLGAAAFNVGSTGIVKAFNRAVLTPLTPGGLAILLGIGAAVYVGVLGIIYIIAERQERAGRPWLYTLVPFVVLSPGAAVVARVCGFSLNVPQIESLSPLHDVALLFYLFSLLFIAVGLGALALRRCRMTFDAEFAALACASVVILLMVTVVPSLAFEVNTTRIFQISTLVLAPFGIVGAFLIARAPTRVRSVAAPWIATRLDVKLVACFVVLTLLFSTGFVYEVTQQDPTSFFLNDGIDAARFNEREVSAAQWLYDNGLNRSTSRPGGVPAYADAYRSLLLSSIRYSDVPWDLRNWSSSTLQDAYAYYGTFNLATGESAQQGASKTFLNGTVISHVPIVAAPGCAKLYDDGGAVVYYRDPMRHTFPSSKR